MLRWFFGFVVLLMKKAANFAHGQQLTVPAVFFVCTVAWNFIDGDWSADIFKRNPWGPLFPAITTAIMFFIILAFLAAIEVNNELLTKNQKEAANNKIIIPGSTPVSIKAPFFPGAAPATVFIGLLLMLERFAF